MRCRWKPSPSLLARDDAKIDLAHGCLMIAQDAYAARGRALSRRHRADGDAPARPHAQTLGAEERWPR